MGDYYQFVGLVFYQFLPLGVEIGAEVLTVHEDVLVGIVALH